MKKIALLFLGYICLTLPAFGNVHIAVDAVVETVKAYVDADKWNPTIKEYNAQLKASNGTGIAASKLWNVCAAAGWNVKEPTGKAKCEALVSALLKNANVKFYEVCDTKGKAAAQKQGGITYCIDDFFTNKLYGGTQVGISEGIQLAKEYARIKHGDSSLQCSGKPTKRLGGLDAGIKCASKDKNAYYEFVFDDLEESIDKTHHDDVQRAICRLHDAKAAVAGCSGGGTNVSGTMTCWDASCAADNAKCVKIDASLSHFGYSARYENGVCVIDFNSVRNASELKTAFGIDNFVFCAGIQVQNNVSVETYLKQYVAQKAGVSVGQVKCDAGTKTYTGPGCKVNGVTDFKDDIKTCYVGNNQIDFVFNDINEAFKSYQHGGLQGMGCIAAGGTYTGKRCLDLNEQACDVLRKSNIQNCPECKSVRWDSDTQTCVLPSSESATKLEKGINLAVIGVGGAVGAVVTIAMIPAAVAAGGITAGVGMGTIVFLESAGSAIEFISQMQINGMADEFFVESSKCKSASCATNLIIRHLDRLASIQGDLTDAEANAIDSEIARLAELIPDNSSLWSNTLSKGLTLADNEKGLLEGWTGPQLWRAFGVGLQFTSMVSGVLKWVKASKNILPKGTSVLERKITAAVNRMKLNPTQERFYRAWAEYAPRNQSLDDFIKMFDGDLDKLDETVKTKNWKPLYQRADDIASLRQSFLHDTQDLAEKLNLYTKFDDTDVSANIIKKYKDDYVRWNPEYADEINAWYAKYADIWDDKHFVMKTQKANYAVEDPEIARLVQMRDNDPTLKQDLEALEILRAEREATLSQEEYQEWLDYFYRYELDRVYMKDTKRWNIITARDVQLTTLDDVAEERAIIYDHVISSDSKLKKMARNWNELSNEERINFAQDLINRTQKYLGGDNIKVVQKAHGDGINGSWNGFEIKLDVERDYADVIATLSHEQGHAIDDINTGMGALGSERTSWAKGIYTSKDTQAYEHNLLEQSSFAIGNKVKETQVKFEPFNMNKLINDDHVRVPAAVGIGGAGVAVEIEILDAIFNAGDNKTK